MSYQKLIIAGRLGADPQMRYTGDGTAVTSMSIATDRRWKDRATGETKTQTTWFRVSVWGAQAEPCNQYLRKGRMALVEGEMQEPRIYQASNGDNRCALEVRANSVTFLGGASDTPKPANSDADVFDSVDTEDIPF